MTTSIVNFGRSSIGPLQEAMRVGLALSDDQMALVQGAALALPLSLASIPCGYSADRYSRVRLLLWSVVASLVGALLTALASSFVALFLARCFVGLAIAGMGPAMVSLISDYVPPQQRGRATMIMLIGALAGMATAFSVGGQLLTSYAAESESWRRAAFWLVVPHFVGLAVVLLMREPARMSRAEVNPSVRTTLVGLWRCRWTIAPLLVGFVVVSIGDVAAVVWAAPTFMRTFGLSADRIGALMGTLVFVSGLGGPVAGGMLSDLSLRSGGIPRVLSLLTALAVVSIPASLFPLMPNADLSAVLLLVFMAAGYSISTVTTTLSMIVIPNELRGVCTALFNVAGGVLGIAAAPVAVSLISRALGGPAMIGSALALVSGGTAALGALAFALGRASRAGRPDAATCPEKEGRAS